MRVYLKFLSKKKNVPWAYKLYGKGKSSYNCAHYKTLDFQGFSNSSI